MFLNATLVECLYRYVLEVFSLNTFQCSYHARVVFNKCSAYVCIILLIFPRYLIFYYLTYDHIVSNLRCFYRNTAFVTNIVLVLHSNDYKIRINVCQVHNLQKVTTFLPIIILFIVCVLLQRK